MDEKVINMLSSFDILSSLNTSDIIVVYKNKKDDMYVNIHTNKTSCNFFDVIRKEKHYVFVNSNGIKQEKNAWAAKYFAEDNIIVFCFFRLQKNENSFFIKEFLRLILTVDENYNPEFVAFEDGNEVDIPYNIIMESSYYFDLCGQYIHNNNNPTAGINVALSSRDESNEFLHGACRIKKNGTINQLDETIVFTYNCCLYNLLTKLLLDEQSRKTRSISFGIKNINMEGVKISPLSVPSHIDNILGCHFKNCIDSYSGIKYDNFTIQKFELLMLRGFEVGMLENCEGEYVLRRFFVCIAGNMSEDGKRIPLKYIETKRIHITKDIINDFRDILIPVIFFDRKGINEGIFKYAVNHLEKTEAKTLKALENHDTNLFDNCYDYNINSACAAVFMPFYEKLFNVLYKNYENNRCHDFFAFLKPENSIQQYGYRTNVNPDKRFLILEEYSRFCKGNIKEEIQEIFGFIDFSKRELPKMLGISKPMFNIFINDSAFSFGFIKTLKFIFEGNESYFLQMNTDTSKRLIEYLNKSHCGHEDDFYPQCLKKLLRLLGTGNLFGYCEFLSDRKNKTEKQYIDYLNMYNHYLDKLIIIGVKACDLQWKFKNEEELIRTDNAITNAYTLMNDKVLYKTAYEKFASHFYEWKQYEYRSNKFFITYPKGPTDLIEEGFKLKHCAKEYIDSVADGKTIILFIRQVDNPNKPFFTLEITDENIRQCHGFDNCNVSSFHGLKAFILKFCKEKGLKILNLDTCYGL